MKQNLVFNNTTGNIIGFTDIGHRLNRHASEELATHALTLYIKSFCGNPGLKYPLAYFATRSVTGPQLASIMWEAIGLLEHLGLKVSDLLNISYSFVVV